MPEIRSPTEPVPAHPSTSPWIRTAEDDERAELAERIGELVSRWELGTVHRVQALAASLELDLRGFLVLSELAVRPAGLTAARLTGVVGGGAARMSVLLTGLERRGLVERGPDPFDRRAIVVGVTDRTRELLPHEPAPRLRHLLRQELPRIDQLDAVRRFVDTAVDLAYRHSRDLRGGAPRWR